MPRPNGAFSGWLALCVKRRRGRPLNSIVRFPAKGAPHFAIVVLGSFLCAGCIGIGHVRVFVPEVAIALRSVEPNMTVDLVCPKFYAESDAFSALVGSSLSANDYHYDWKRLQIGFGPVREVCRAEDRYVGFPAIAFLPTSPSDDSAKARALLLHIVGEPNLYRVRFIGKSASVDTLQLADARRDYPQQLTEPEPQPLDPKWGQRIQLRLEYYRSMKWEPSNRIVVKDVETDGHGAIDSITLEIRATEWPRQQPGERAPI